MDNDDFAFGCDLDSDRTMRVDRIVDVANELLQKQPHLSMQPIWCEFAEGELFLRGHLPSFYLKQLAQTAVAGLDGVRHVVNEIEVV